MSDAIHNRSTISRFFSSVFSQFSNILYLARCEAQNTVQAFFENCRKILQNVEFAKNAVKKTLIFRAGSRRKHSSSPTANEKAKVRRVLS
jgi:hypothetical protein